MTREVNHPVFLGRQVTKLSRSRRTPKAALVRYNDQAGAEVRPVHTGVEWLMLHSKANVEISQRIKGQHLISPNQK